MEGLSPNESRVFAGGKWAFFFPPSSHLCCQNPPVPPLKKERFHLPGSLLRWEIFLPVDICKSKELFLWFSHSSHFDTVRVSEGTCTYATRSFFDIFKDIFNYIFL